MASPVSNTSSSTPFIIDNQNPHLVPTLTRAAFINILKSHPDQNPLLKKGNHEISKEGLSLLHQIFTACLGTINAELARLEPPKEDSSKIAVNTPELEIQKDGNPSIPEEIAPQEGSETEIESNSDPTPPSRSSTPSMYTSATDSGNLAEEKKNDPNLPGNETPDDFETIGQQDSLDSDDELGITTLSDSDVEE